MIIYGFPMKRQNELVSKYPHYIAKPTTPMKLLLTQDTIRMKKLGIVFLSYDQSVGIDLMFNTDAKVMVLSQG